jgi:FMN phosphatase YigB (HAD superfamily)
MVGDNPVADIDGARRVGIRGVLVASTHGSGARGLLDATDVILNA